MKIDCIHWSPANISGGGRCRIEAHGAPLVSFSVCQSCRQRVTENGPVKQVIPLLQAEQIRLRLLEIRPICESCKEGFGGFTSLSGEKFEGIIRCQKCSCPMKITPINRPCPLGKFGEMK